MRIAVGADHAACELKAHLLTWLRARDLEPVDIGPPEPSAEDDYPDISQAVCRSVLEGDCQLGIMMCGTGVGSCIAANKIPGIRAALCHDTYSARLSRRHNDANVLCLGARVVGEGLAREIVATWLEEDFSEEARHRRRLEKVTALEHREREP